MILIENPPTILRQMPGKLIPLLGAVLGFRSNRCSTDLLKVLVLYVEKLRHLACGLDPRRIGL